MDPFVQIEERPETSDHGADLSYNIAVSQPVFGLPQEAAEAPLEAGSVVSAEVTELLPVKVGPPQGPSGNWQGCG